MPRYFTLAEMTRTDSGLPNSPDTWEKADNLRRTAERLDRIREAFGAPVRVNSGYRSPEVNRAAGGSATSAHLAGNAADIRACSGGYPANARLLEACRGLVGALGIDQLIYYMDAQGVRWIHVGWRPLRGRGQVFAKRAK